MIIWYLLVAMMATTPATGVHMAQQADSSATVFNFAHESDVKRWVAVNDNVMGGISSGRVSATEDSCMLFSGTLSLENNGGFASVRSRVTDFDFSGYTGIRIRVKGDGRIYQFRIRLDENFDGIAYRHEFETSNNTWLDVYLPFDKFIPTYRGRTLRDVEPIDPSQICQMGLLIADKNAGPFELTIDVIEAYK